MPERVGSLAEDHPMSLHRRWLTVLAGLIAALAAIASGAGVVLRGDLATQPFVTVRGDLVDVLSGGVYRFNGKAIASEGVGWDVVTLIFVVPFLLALLPRFARGSDRAALAVVGVLAYLLYQYAEYAMALAYGPLFLLYVAIFALSLAGIALTVGSLDLEAIRDRIGDRFPHRAVIAFGVFMAALLGGMWLPLVARTASATSVPELAAGTTLVVQAFDLGFLVPLGLFTAAAVHRRLGIGYVLAAVVAVKGIAMGSAIAAMLLFEGWATGVFQVPPIVLFACVAVAAAALAARVFGNVRDRPVRAPDRQASAASPKSVDLTSVPDRS
jgi:hypothetical protein